MTEQMRSPLERWFQFNLVLLGYAVNTQAQLGRAYLNGLETTFGSGKGGASAGGPAAPEPRKPVIPADLPMLLRAQWMLGMLFAGWRLPAAETR